MGIQFTISDENTHPTWSDFREEREKHGARKGKGMLRQNCSVGGILEEEETGDLNKSNSS